MNIRLRKATIDDFAEYKRYHMYNAYDWMHGDEGVRERKESIKHQPERKPPKPKYNKLGIQIIRGRIKFLLYDEEQFERDLKGSNSYHAVLDGDKLIGFIQCADITRQKKRIVEFALELDYQKKDVIKRVTELIIGKKDRRIVLISVDEYGKKLIKGIEEIDIGFE